MKFGKLIEYNLRNIFVEKSYTKCAAELFPHPYLKYQNWAYLWINSVCKVLNSFFYCMLIWGLSKYSEIKKQTTCFYLI